MIGDGKIMSSAEFLQPAGKLHALGINPHTCPHWLLHRCPPPTIMPLTPAAYATLTAAPDQIPQAA